MKNGLLKRILISLSAVGPGLFLIGYNIGTGSVTTMAKAGAEHGMNLTWALLLSCLFTYVLMVAYGQTTLVTGATALNNIKKHFRLGPALALYIMIALIIGELLALIGIFGIVTDLIQEGFRLLTGRAGPDTVWITLVLVVLLYLLFWYGAYKRFEKVLMFFVILMGLSFIAVFFMVRPDISAIVTGLAPNIPKQDGAFRLIAAMAGTTCSAAVFIMRSTVVAEKGWDIRHLRQEKRDSLVSASTMFLLSFIIMAVAAGTLKVMGLKLDNTVEMISLFEPIGGRVAALMLILGIVGAGLSTIFPIILIAPWLISDYTGTPRNIRSPMYRMLGLIGILFGFGMQFLDTTPPLLMIMAMAFQALILPAVAIPILILINQKTVMQQHTASPWLKAGLWAVVVFSLLTSYFAVVEFL
jgi:Mn2+/Fe2+ NRAMP family transporter